MKKQAFGKLYKELFYIPKHEKLSDKVFRCRMVLSLLTILACTAIMVASTYAWFNVSVSTGDSTLVSAYYSVTVSNTENNKYNCPLTTENMHTFEIKAEGTATTGYCKIQIDDKVYYTDQIQQGSSLTLNIQAAQGTVITFTPQWGTSSYYVNEGTCGNNIIHSTTSYAVYTVEPTAKLADIAAHYGVAESDILVYNNISAVAAVDEASENVIQLEPGTELKIPGITGDVTPYEVPHATYIVEPTATLDAISEHYDVSGEDILAYNDITEITEGFALNIPGVAQDIEPYKAPVSEQAISSVSKLENIDTKKSQTLTSDDVLLDDGLTKKEPIVGIQSSGDAKSPDLEDEQITDSTTEKENTTEDSDTTETTDVAEESGSEVAEEDVEDAEEEQDDTTEAETETVADTKAETEIVDETEVEIETETVTGTDTTDTDEEKTEEKTEEQL